MAAVAAQRQPHEPLVRSRRSGRAAQPRPALTVVPQRRRWPTAVAVLAWTALVVFLFGAAVFHTQLAERQLRIDHLQRAVQEQRKLFEDLRYERAELRSPNRLAAAAGELGMTRGDTTEFVRIDPLAVARELAAAGVIDDATSRVVVDTDPLTQFRNLKAVSDGMP
jgi:cell division protein FtsL